MSAPDEVLTWRDLWAVARAARPHVDRSAEDDEDGEDDDDDPFARFDASSPEVLSRLAQRDEALAAWRFVASALASRGQVEGIPLLAWMVQLAEEHGAEDRPTAAYAIQHALRNAATRAHELPHELEAALADPREEVRTALAQNVSLEHARAALMTLARDPHPSVRSVARARLGDDAPPWWAGIVPTDPEPGLDAPARAALARLRAARELSWLELIRAPEIEIVEAAAALPEPLAIAMLATLAEGAGGRDAPVAWLRAAAGRPGSAPAVLQVLRVWCSDDWFSERALASFASLEQPRRIELGVALASAILSRAEAPDPFEIHVAEVMCAVLALVWPREADPGVPLAVLLGGTPAGAADRAPQSLLGLYALGAAIDPAHPGLEALRAPIVDAIRRGQPGAWTHLPHAIVTRFEPALRAERRAAAQADLRATDFERQRRAVRSLLGSLHDPETDPPVPQLATSLYADPLTRSAVLASSLLPPALLRRARRDLAAGRLDAVQAARVLECVGERSGGIAEPDPAPDSLMGRRRRRGGRGARKRGVAVTEREWETFRALRDAVDLAALSSADLAALAGTLPPGPSLDAGDERVVRAAVDRWLATSDEELRWIVYALSGKRGPAVEALLVEVFERVAREGSDEVRAMLVNAARVWSYPERALDALRALDREGRA